MERATRPCRESSCGVLSKENVAHIFFRKKMIYLHHRIFVFETVCTIAFYATRGTKLDLTCIYFDDVFYSCQIAICYHINCQDVYT